MKADLITVLLVEDDPGDVLLIREAFAEQKVGNRLEGRQRRGRGDALRARRGPVFGVGAPDLILLDLNLPRKSGAEVLAEIKADPALAMIPIVVLTTSESEEDVLRAYRHSRQRLHHQARRLRSLPRDRAPDRRVLRRRRQAAATGLNPADAG